MNREIHVRLRESLRVRFPWATRPGTWMGENEACPFDLLAQIYRYRAYLVLGVAAFLGVKVPNVDTTGTSPALTSISVQNFDQSSPLWSLLRRRD
jgi:hypothetical protein